MDPNTSIGRLCLGENNQGLVAEGIENKEQWEGPEFQDTASSGQEKEARVFTFYRMEEKGERYFTPCYMGGLHAYDGEINLKYEKNLISNESTVKLCLEYEEKNREKLVKKELLVSLKGEFYFVKFIINPKEDDVDPSMILGRSFMRLTKGITHFGNGIITIHPKLVLKKPRSLRMIGIICLFGDIPEIDKAEEAAREALAIDISKRFSILEEDRPVIETMAYCDKYKKILDGIVMDKLKLDGEIKKEEEEAIKQVKGEALKEKENPRAFVIPIRIEAKIDLRTYGSSEGCSVPTKTILKTEESDSDDEEEYGI
ncbi:hypothetical protein Tco_1405430 [Tanacetum coccineum]